MAARPWYKHYPQDFLEGAEVLSLEEVGACITILNLIYRDGRPVADDDDRLAHACRVSIRKWRSLRATLIAKEKLFVSGGCLMNQRAEQVLASGGGR